MKNKKQRSEDDYIIYIVQIHDTLDSIANKYDVTVNSIIKINELEDNNIQVGQQLYIKRKNDTIPIFFLIIMLIALIAGASFITFALTDYFTNQAGGGANNIDLGTVVFSFNEADNSVELSDAYPISDEDGKKLSGVNEYFDFSVSFQMAEDVEKVIYEINLVEGAVSGVKLDPKYVKVYLEENDAVASGFDGSIPLFSSLKASELRIGSKVLFSKTIESTQTNSYRFRMWVADGYRVDDISRIFKCFLNVDGYVA